MIEARDRGLLFDVGHGRGSFDFDVAKTAIHAGFLPDSISTDLQRGHIGQSPPHDLPLVMSKLRAAGMSECDVFRAVTFHPAKILGISDEVGSLQAGSRADLVLLRRHSSQPLVDTSGKTRAGECWEAVTTIQAGKLVSRSTSISE